MSPQADSTPNDSFATRAAAEQARAEAAGQGHVFRFWGELSHAGSAQLLEQLEAVDYDLLAKLG
ncbi:MAG: hypothetical protein OSB10_07130, partial [Planctomycetota bacterium]|nr:hypothetical protein [Planctomycetota bacterium]